MPWGYRRGGVADHLLVGRLIFIPQRALGDVVHGELPVLRGLFQPVEKAQALFFLRQVEKKFDHHRAVACQMLLKGGNVLEAFAPDRGFSHQRQRDFLLPEHFRVDAHHQHFLVIGAVEDANAAALGQADRGPPQKIVVELLRRRRLERMDLAALRVDAVEHAVDRAILARRIHALKDQQQRPAILRV